MSCAFDGRVELALMLGAGRGFTAIQDTCVRREEALQELGLFIVYSLEVVVTKVTLFG